MTLRTGYVDAEEEDGVGADADLDAGAGGDTWGRNTQSLIQQNEMESEIWS